MLSLTIVAALLSAVMLWSRHSDPLRDIDVVTAGTIFSSLVSFFGVCRPLGSLKQELGPTRGGILYLVKTWNGTLQKRAKLMQEGWMRHVLPEDKVVFLCDEQCTMDPSLDSVLKVPMFEFWPNCPHEVQHTQYKCGGYALLPLKVGAGILAAVSLLQQHLPPQWYVVCDDDTYIVPANMRSLLEQFDPSKPLVIGQRKSHTPAGVFGGAGWAMSHAAVENFAQTYPEYMQKSEDQIRQGFIYDDILMPEWTVAHFNSSRIWSDKIETALPGFAEHVGMRPCRATWHLSTKSSKFESMVDSLTQHYLAKQPKSKDWQLFEGWMCGRTVCTTGGPNQTNACHDGFPHRWQFGIQSC